MSHNPNLIYVDCSSCTSLTTLNVNGATNLEELTCYWCDLTELDVSNNPNLAYLGCWENTSLSKLNVNGAINLVKLNCDHTSITELDVSSNLNLKYLDCNSISTLTKLILNGAFSLKEVQCTWCALTTIDIGNHPNLRKLVCQFNQLESIDVTGCPSLAELYCYCNNISRLRISNNPELKVLIADNNPLTHFYIYACPYLIETVQNAVAKKDMWTEPDLGITVEYWEYYYYVPVGDGSSDTYACSIDFDEGDQFILEEPTFNVTVTTDGNGTATSSVASGKEGTEVTLTASPNPGYQFKEWKVVSGYVTVENNKFVIEDANVEIKAIFELAPRTVTVTTDGNGTAAASVASGVMGTQVTLSAVPNEGYVLESWQVIPGDVTVTNNTFTIGTSNVEIKAIFRPANFGDFIDRLYRYALLREPEADGKAFWMNKVMNEGFTGGRCAYGFLVEAQEFLNRDLTNEQFIDTLYLIFFYRAPDEGGKAFWLQKFAEGMTRAEMVNGFIDSTEWCNLCALYGVKSGAPNAKAEKPSKNAEKFAYRLYTECLGREPEADGLKFWALRLTNLESSGYEAALGFFTSQEFQQKGIGDDEFIHRLYRTFMGRDEDADGFAFWKSHLGVDMTREDLIKGFAQSQEFTNICNEYGIDKGI